MTASAPAPSRTPIGWLGRLGVLAVAAFIMVRMGPDFSASLGVAPSDGWTPTFTVATLDGDTLRSPDLKGKVVVVNFWATWCAPCRREMPALQKLHEALGESGLVVLGLSTDVGPEEPIRAFLAEEGITYPVGRATQAHRTAFLGIAGVPVTFILDRNGMVRERVLGYFEGSAMNAAVDRVLAAP